MDKVYERIIYQNSPSTATALGATNLNKMDYAINVHDDRIVAMDTSKANQSTVNTVVQSITYNESTGVLTITKVNGTSTTIDTKLEKLAVNFVYNPETQQLDITLDDGTVQHVDMSALVTQYEFEDTDTVSFSVESDGTIKANIILGSITGDYLQPDYLADIIVQANISVTNAQLSKRYAVGGVVPEDAEDNAKYYKEIAEEAAAEAEAIAGFNPLEYYKKTEIDTTIGDRTLLPIPNMDLVTAINENKTSIDGKINKNSLVYNIKDFGATGNGSTDDYNNIKTAVDLLNITGGILYIPIGNFKISQSIQITRPCIIMGTGNSSKITPYSNVACLLDIQSTLVSIENLNLENTNSLATRAIEVINSNDDTPIIFNNLYIALFTRGILWRDGARCIIQNCTMVSNALTFESLNDCRNSVFTNLYTLGGSGILLGGNDSKAEGVEITNCYLFPGNNGDVNSFAVKIVSGLAITISNCILDQVVTGSAVVIDGANTKDIHIRNCWIGANYNSTTTSYGILQIHGSGIHISECTIVGFDQSGIYIQGASTRTNNLIYIDNCDFLNGDPNLRDIQLDYATNVMISRCKFSGASNIVEQNNCSGVVKDCYFTNVPSRTHLKYHNQLNDIVKTIGYGTATILATQRTVTVAHGMSYAPDISDINVVLQGFPSNNENIGSVVIDSITSSTFRIVIQTATTVSNVVFSWKARAAE